MSGVLEAEQLPPMSPFGTATSGPFHDPTNKTSVIQCWRLWEGEETWPLPKIKDSAPLSTKSAGEKVGDHNRGVTLVMFAVTLSVAIASLGATE